MQYNSACKLLSTGPSTKQRLCYYSYYDHLSLVAHLDIQDKSTLQPDARKELFLQLPQGNESCFRRVVVFVGFTHEWL